jgi:CDGSH-type Zn-finger protein/uncharacterized Fe-S cluster protein YjdI
VTEPAGEERSALGAAGFYSGRELDVRWEARLCIHVGECTRAQSEVFVSGRRPWGDPDLATADQVAEIVHRCPTGALSYVRKDGRAPELPPDTNTIVVSNNGPLYVHGDLRIVGAPEDVPGLRTRAALCRCGRSKRKPFCDNSHERSPFRDRGAIGAVSGPARETGGALEVEPLENGPFVVRGHVTLVTAYGRPAWHGEKATLCRCGHSGNKPFCDGTHAKIGFVSAVR